MNSFDTNKHKIQNLINQDIDNKNLIDKKINILSNPKLDSSIFNTPILLENREVILDAQTPMWSDTTKNTLLPLDFKYWYENIFIINSNYIPFVEWSFSLFYTVDKTMVPFSEITTHSWGVNIGEIWKDGILDYSGNSDGLAYINTKNALINAIFFDNGMFPDELIFKVNPGNYPSPTVGTTRFITAGYQKRFDSDPVWIRLNKSTDNQEKWFVMSDFSAMQMAEANQATYSTRPVEEERYTATPTGEMQGGQPTYYYLLTYSNYSTKSLATWTPAPEPMTLKVVAEVRNPLNWKKTSQFNTEVVS